MTHRDTGKLKGVFVEFGSKENLQSALQLNGQVCFHNATLKLTFKALQLCYCLTQHGLCHTRT